MPFPTPYLTQSPAPAVPQPRPGPDATQEFAARLNDPNRWIIKQGVPIFKAHERTDPATGQLIRVDLPKLYRIAENMQRLERDTGTPVRMTLGHTEPGKPEPQQPPVGGYYRNARVQPFGPKGEPAVVVDEYLDPQYAAQRKNYPYRSSEYYDDAEQITGVALLTRDPYLDLGVVAYSSDREPLHYRIDESRPKPPTHYSWNGRRPVLYHLVIGENPYMIPPNQYGPAPQQGGPASPDVQQYVADAGAVQLGADGQVYAAPQFDQYGQPIQYGAAGEPTQYGFDVGGAVRGGVQGAATGARFGPYGIAGGAALGGLAGGFGHMGKPGQTNPLAGNRGLPVARPTQNAQYSAPWPPMGGQQNHRPPSMHRQHPSGGAVYAQTPYLGTGTVAGGAIGAGLGMGIGGTEGALIGGGLGALAGSSHDQTSQPKPAAMRGIMNSRYANNGYGNTRYEDPPMGPPPGAGGPPPGGPGGGSGDPLEQLQMLAMAMVEVLGQLQGGGSGGPPPGGPGGGPPPGPGPMGPDDDGAGAPYSRGPGRYANAPQQSQSRPQQGRSGGGQRRGYSPYANPGDPVNYGYPNGVPVGQYGRPLYPQAPARRPAPTPYGAPPAAGTTISGRPVGQALRESQLQYQLQQQEQALRVLMYERDQADNMACYEAIQRLADAGYPVSELEVGELKRRKPGDERQVYLDTIATKYQKIGTQSLPPLLGDPTPAGPDPDANRPATQEEMDKALKMMGQNPQLQYAQALQYAKQGGAPTQYGAAPGNRIAGYAEMPTAPMANGFDPTNPYGEPSRNGQY